MLDFMPGYDEYGQLILFDVVTQFTIWPSNDCENDIKPNGTYFIYGEPNGRTFYTERKIDNAFIDHGFMKTDKEGNWLPLMIIVR